MHGMHGWDACIGHRHLGAHLFSVEAAALARSPRLEGSAEEGAVLAVLAKDEEDLRVGMRFVRLVHAHLPLVARVLLDL